jgi:hypothetical protein
MPATRSWLELGGHHLLPIVALDVEDMNIIHPMYSIIASEIDDLRVYQTSSG